MDDAALVGRFVRLCDLSRDRERLVEAEWTSRTTFGESESNASLPWQVDVPLECRAKMSRALIERHSVTPQAKNGLFTDLSTAI